MLSFPPVFAVYPLWFYLKVSRDVSKVVNGSRGEGVSVDEVGVGLVVEGRGGGISGPPALRLNHRATV